VKLVDFGVAKAVGRISEATRAGQLKGKFGYMSPEQALGKAVDRRSDIFSLGIVLFELTTSRRLFRGEHDLETLRLVISGAIPKPTLIDAKYPPELERIVLKALDRDVSERYQTAAEFEHDLRAYLKSERLIVPQSGVAGILKRVLGDRIEQRRKALRAALKALSSGPLSGAQLLPNDPAFTPTGRDHVSISGVSDVTGSGSSESSARGNTGTPAEGAPRAQLHDRSESERGLPPVRLSTASLLGYAIGLTGLAIALFVLIFMR
jgi:serine/threonine-protein kinase